MFSVKQDISVHQNWEQRPVTFESRSKSALETHLQTICYFWEWLYKHLCHVSINCWTRLWLRKCVKRWCKHRTGTTNYTLDSDSRLSPSAVRYRTLQTFVCVHVTGVYCTTPCVHLDLTCLFLHCCQSVSTLLTSLPLITHQSVVVRSRPSASLCRLQFSRFKIDMYMLVYQEAFRTPGSSPVRALFLNAVWVSGEGW